MRGQLTSGDILQIHWKHKYLYQELEFQICLLHLSALHQSILDEHLGKRKRSQLLYHLKIHQWHNSLSTLLQDPILTDNLRYITYNCYLNTLISKTGNTGTVWTHGKTRCTKLLVANNKPCTEWIHVSFLIWTSTFSTIRRNKTNENLSGSADQFK